MSKCFDILTEAGVDIGIDAKKLAFRNKNESKAIWLDAANKQLAELKAIEGEIHKDVEKLYAAAQSGHAKQLLGLSGKHQKLIDKVLSSKFANGDSAITELDGVVWLHDAENDPETGDKFANKSQKEFLGIVEAHFNGDMQAAKDAMFANGAQQGSANAQEPNDLTAHPAEVVGEPSQKAQKIEDTGEKLGDAKKDKWNSMRDAIPDEDIAKHPLSVVWPKQDLSKIEDDYIAAFVYAARSSIPTKPQKSHRLSRWVEQVKSLRKYVDDILTGETNKSLMQEAVARSPVLNGFVDKLQLLQKLDRSLWEKVGMVQNYPNAYRYGEGGEKLPAASISVNKKFYEYGTSWEEALDKIKSDLGAKAPETSTKFEVRKAGKVYFVNKVGDPEYRRLKTFDNQKEAIDYKNNNKGDLVAAWEAVKSRDNVTEKDVRNQENRPRTGKDHRGGNKAVSYITEAPETYYEHTSTGRRLPENLFNDPAYGVRDKSEWKKIEGVRPEVATAFAGLVKALDGSPMYARSRLLDKGKKRYWSTVIERAARSFENYIIHEMENRGYMNDYLANVKSVGEFHNQGRYPYLKPEELQPIKDAFDALFKTIKTKEVDGKTVMYSRSQSTKDAYEKRIDALFKTEVESKSPTKVLDNSDMLGLLGFKNVPVYLVENKVVTSKNKHELTADDWKQLPDMIDNPAMIFESNTREDNGRFVFVTNRISSRGLPIVVILQPLSSGGLEASLLINAYGKDNASSNFTRWLDKGLLRYFDKDLSLGLRRTIGLYLPNVNTYLTQSLQSRNSSANINAKQSFPRSAGGKIYAGKKIYQRDDLVKYRNQKDGGLKASNTSQTPSTGLTITRTKEVLRGKFGKIVDRLLERGQKGFKGGVVVAKDMAEAKRYLGNGKYGEYSMDGSIQGFYNQDTGITVLVAENLDETTAPKVFLHEVGVHARRLGANEKEFNAIKRQALKLSKTNPLVNQALYRALDAFGLKSMPLNGAFDSTGGNIYSKSDTLKAKTFINKLIDSLDKLTIIDNSRISWGMDSSIKQNSSNSSGRSPKSLSDLLNIESRLFEPNGSINIETVRMMQSGMRTTVNNDKIFQSVIKTAPVNMMDMFIGKQSPSEFLLHNPSVLIDLPSIAINKPIPLSIKTAIAISKAMSMSHSAAFGTSNSIVPSYLSGASISNRSTNKTSDFFASPGGFLGGYVTGQTSSTLHRRNSATGDTIKSRHVIDSETVDNALDEPRVSALGSSPIITQDDVLEETLAYLVEVHPELSISQKIIAWFKNALREFAKLFDPQGGLYLNSWINSLSTADIAYMARAGMKRAAKGEVNLSAGNQMSQEAKRQAKEQRQYDEIERKYFNPDGTEKPGAMLAPNGKRTNLNKRQWIQVRTQAFKDWFGDWETLAKEPKTTELVLKDWDGSLKELAKIAKKVYSEILQGKEFTNEDTDNLIRFTAEGKTEAFGGIKGNIDAEVVGALSRLVERAVLIDSVLPESDRVHDTAFFHTYVAPLSIDGHVYTVKLTIREALGGPEGIARNKFYDIAILRKGPIGTGLANPQGTGASTSHGPNYSVSELLAVFKGENERHIPQSSKVIDKNNEPLVVYHGARKAGFSIFNVNGKGKTLNTGSWFSETKEAASTYSNTRREVEFSGSGKNGIYSVYLKLKNPLFIDADGAHWTEIGAPNIFLAIDDNEEIIESFDNEEDANRFKKYSTKAVSIEKIKDPGTGVSTDEVVREAKATGAGYDGVIFDNVEDNGIYERILNTNRKIYVAFDPGQIKSATGNTGAFSKTNDDIRFSTAPRQKTESWLRWFKQSKMKRGGEPIKFYHGSQFDFTVFDKSKLATNTAHTTAGLGHFFTEDKGEASNYGGNVHEVYLSIQNPYVVTPELLDERMGDDAQKFADKLKAQGYDGIYVKDAKYAIAFDSNQVKLTGNESPSASPDIRFSKAMPTVQTAVDFVSGRDRNVNKLSDIDKILATGKMPNKKLSYQGVKDKVTETMFDSSRPFDAWTRQLPNQVLAGEMILAKDRAKRRAADFEKTVVDNYLTPLAKVVSDLAKEHKLDYRAAKELVGQWLTVRYALEKNQDYIRQDQAAVGEAQANLDEKLAEDKKLLAEGKLDIQPTNAALKTALAKAKEHQSKRLAAINEDRIVDPTLEQLDVGLAGGYNNKTAQHYLNAIGDKLGETKLKEAGGHVYSLLAWKLKQDLKNGKVTKEIVDKWFNSPVYVPLTGDPMADEDEDPLFQHGSLNQQSDKKAEGRMGSIAQNGIDAAIEAAQKSARYHGWVDFKDKLSEIYSEMVQEGMDNNLKSQEIAREIKDKYGLGVSRETALTRTSDSGIIIRKGGKSLVIDLGDKKAVEALKNHNREEIPSLLQPVAYFTRSYGKLVTQFLPGFGAVNAIRDTWERSENIRTRTLPGYENLDMDKVARNALKEAADPRLVKKLMGVMAEHTPLSGRFSVDDTDPDIQVIREMIGEGATGTVGDYLSNTGKDLSKQMETSLKLTNKAMRVISAWNNAFELVSTFSIYKSLRNAGVDKKVAASGTLNLMNFGKQGTAVGPIKALYVFANPALIGGHQLVKTLSTRKGQARAAAYLVIGMALYAMLRAIDGDDDELDVSKMDHLSNFIVERNIPIPLGDGDYLKIPVGFGMPQLAWSTASNLVKYMSGSQTAYDSGAEIMKSMVKSIAPVQPSETIISKQPLVWLTQTFTPQVGKPLANIAMNVNTFGGELTNSKYKKQGVSVALQGKESTADFYKDVAETLAKTFGVQMYPEQVRELMKGYFSIGPGSEIMKALVENPNKKELGRDSAMQALDRFIAHNDSGDLKERLYYAARTDMAKAQEKLSLGKQLDQREKKLVNIGLMASKMEASSRGKLGAASKHKGSPMEKAYRAQADRIRDRIMTYTLNAVGRINE